MTAGAAGGLSAADRATGGGELHCDQVPLSLFPVLLWSDSDSRMPSVDIRSFSLDPLPFFIPSFLFFLLILSILLGQL